MLAGHTHPVLYCYQFLWKLIDLIYPPVCGGCEKPGGRWCEECRNKVKKIPAPYCLTCGLPLNRSGFCLDCSGKQRDGFLVRSWAIYEGSLRNAIHRLKYNNDIGLAEVFAGYMAKDLIALNWDANLVLAVPLADKRKRERGYNQAALLARLIALEMNLSFSNKGIMRIRQTISQTRLNAVERRKNVENAFMARADIVRGKRILLIDDLATTCATLEACTTALLHAGADLVHSFTLARTL